MAMPLRRRFNTRTEFVNRIKELRRKGLTQMEIAVEMGVAQGTVSVVLRNEGMGGKLARVKW